jgi:isoleucyl-tRNA synthetase
VDQLEATDQRKEADLIEARLENIKLRNKLRRYEQLLRQKEELAEGLHLIDFEQLKIENQTFNEKIEERNDELLKLRKKVTNIVQILTHVKEKLQFEQLETVEFKSQLDVIDEEVTRERDRLPSLKQKRDSIRHENADLRHKNGLLTNTTLLSDFALRVVSSKLTDCNEGRGGVVGGSGQELRETNRMSLTHYFPRLGYRRHSGQEPRGSA